MASTSSVAVESLRLPKAQRYQYVQDQMILLIGRPVSRGEAEQAIRQAEAHHCRRAGRSVIRDRVPARVPAVATVHPVPPSVTAVAGCSCGGLEWHAQDCTIWTVPPDEAMNALGNARRRLREHTEDLNRQLHAALAACQSPAAERPSASISR